MKTNFKRLFALLLTLCILAGMMVPAAFAEETVESPADSVIVAETYPIRLVDLTQPDSAAATGYSKWFKGSGGWKNMAIASTTISGNLDSEYAEGDLNWRYISTNDSQYRFDISMLHQLRLTDKGSWGALQIRVSEAGRYALNLTTDKSDIIIDDPGVTDAGADKPNISNHSSVISWNGDVTAYLIPLADLNAAIEAGAETNAAIESLMTSAYKLGTLEMTKSQTDVTFKKVRMDAGEYVVVYSGTQANYCLSEISLLEDAADDAMYNTYENVATYPIRFVDINEDPTTSTDKYVKMFAPKDGTYSKRINMTAVTELADDYATGALNWKPLAATGTAIYREDSAMQLRVGKGASVALQIKVPYSGYYHLTVGSDRGTEYQYGLKNNFATTKYNIEAYLIDTDALTEAVTAENIAALAVAENSVGSILMADTDTYGKFNKTYMEKGEYVLVFTMAQESAISQFGLELRKLDIPVEAEGAGAVSQHIEVNALDMDDPNMPAGNYDAKRAYIESSYAAGSMDWKVEGYADKFTDANFSFVNGKGMKVATPADSAEDWFALRIRVKQDGNYSLNLKTAGDCAHYAVWMFSAAAETMSAEEIAAQMIPANGIYFQDVDVTSTDAKISAGYLEGEYILVFQSKHKSKTRTIYVDDIILEEEKFTAEDVQFYNFNVYDETNTGYYELINQPRFDFDSKTGVYSPVDANEGQFNNYILNADGTTYTALYTKIYQEGYPTTLNWRPDAVNPVATDASSLSETKYYYFENVDPASGNVMRVDLNNNNSVGTTQYASFMLRVDKAGTYDLNIKGGVWTTLAKIYFVDSFVEDVDNDSIYMTTPATIANVFANGTGLVTEDYVTLSKNEQTVGRVTVETAGDYLIIFETKDEPINQDNDAKDKTTVDDVCLTSITLTPVIAEETAVRVGNVGYETFEAAVAAAEAGQTITLQDNIVAGDVSLGAGVTLNLNGYALNAESVDAVAPGAKIIDTGDGIGKLRADNLQLSENNPQLPLLNAAENYYAFFTVEVEAVATTGKVNATKYWFKINFSNDAALDLIGADTEMRIQVIMEGVYGDKHGDKAGQPFNATATGKQAFTCQWAENSSSYVVVSSVGSSGIENFVLNPAISANGVVISGADMVRG